MLSWILGGLVAFLALGFGAGCMFSAPKYRGPEGADPHSPKAHFDGKQFHNQQPTSHSFVSVLKWMKSRDRGPWPDYTDHPPAPPPPARVQGAEIRVTFVNHSTFLIQTAGLNILTDPIWSSRCSPVSWAGPKRVRPPGVRLEDLPPVDVILISHNHYDHLDAETIRALAKRDQPRIFAGLGNAALLKQLGASEARDMDWWDSDQVSPEVKISFVPAQHFSGRGLDDRDATLWGGFVIEGPGGPLYFAGDTGMGPHFQQIRDRFGPMAVSLIPIGAFRPVWFMSPVHIGPSEAVRAHQILSSAQSFGMHFGTFPLADDGESEPLEMLDRARVAAGITPARFRTLGFGQSWSSAGALAAELSPEISTETIQTASGRN